MLTETDDLAAALDDAARRWPEDAGNRRRLLLHLINEGHRAIDPAVRTQLDRRRRAILDTSGQLAESYGNRYLDDLRSDWPA